jgi:hypothetical protein
MLLLASQICVRAPLARAANQRVNRPVPSSALVYTPGALWNRGDIAARLGVAMGAIYVIDRPTRAGSGGRIFGDPRQYWAHDARVSPSGDLVAFHGRMTTSRARSATDGVGVLDTNGELVTYFPRGETFAWSPRGTRLAVIVPGTGARESSAGRSLILWDRLSRSVRTFNTLPSRVGWAGEDSLLLQLEDGVDVIDTWTGVSTRTGHHGTVVSPDGLYSMRVDRDTQIIEDESGQEVTGRLFNPLRRQGLVQIRSAFWVWGDGADHLMCVSGSDNLYGDNPQCVTAIIDAESGETIADFPGEALGPTGDGRMTVVLRHESSRLETVDLEGIVRRWTRGGEYY